MKKRLACVVALLSMIVAPVTIQAFWSAHEMRPTVEPARVEGLLDSMLVLGDPGPGLTRFVEDSTHAPEERLHAATLLAAYHNRREEPARALLALFYISQELDTKWTPEQALIAAEAYARLGNQEWAEEALDMIPYTHSSTELVGTLRIYGTFETLEDPDSLIEIRSRFERQLERSSDPMAIILSIHGLGLCYLAKGTVSAYDTASALLSIADDDTASAYLCFPLKEYADFGQGLPLIDRLIPYSLYWTGIAHNRRGDGWGALAAWEELFLNHQDSKQWESAAVNYAALQLYRGKVDSVRSSSARLMDRTTSERRLLEARLLYASALSKEECYDTSAMEFAALSRALPAGDTLRVLAYSGMVGALVGYATGIPQVSGIVPGLVELDLSGYNPLAVSGVNCYIAERYLSAHQMNEADSFYRRALRYYPDPITELRARLGMGMITMAQGDWVGSIEHNERALVLIERYDLAIPWLADLQLNMGLAYLERSKSSNGDGNVDMRKARASFREALALDPGGETGEIARRHLDNID